MILRESRKTGGAHNKAETRRQITPLAHLDSLSVLYPLTHSLALTLPCVLRYHAEHAAKSGSPTASPTAKQKRRKGNFFKPNHQKKREKADLLLFLRERNQRIRNRSTPTMFLFFYCFMYTFLSTVVISQEIKFITDKNKF